MLAAVFVVEEQDTAVADPFEAVLHLAPAGCLAWSMVLQSPYVVALTGVLDPGRQC